MKVLVLKTNPELFIDIARLGSGVYTRTIPSLFDDGMSIETIKAITSASDETMNMIEFKTCHIVEDYLMKVILDTLGKESPNLSKKLREKFGIVE